MSNHDPRRMSLKRAPSLERMGSKTNLRSPRDDTEGGRPSARGANQSTMKKPKPEALNSARDNYDTMEARHGRSDSTSTAPGEEGAPTLSEQRSARMEPRQMAERIRYLEKQLVTAEQQKGSLEDRVSTLEFQLVEQQTSFTHKLEEQKKASVGDAAVNMNSQLEKVLLEERIHLANDQLLETKMKYENQIALMQEDFKKRIKEMKAAHAKTEVEHMERQAQLSKEWTSDMEQLEENFQKTLSGYEKEKHHLAHRVKKLKDEMTANEQKFEKLLSEREAELKSAYEKLNAKELAKAPPADDSAIWKAKLEQNEQAYKRKEEQMQRRMSAYEKELQAYREKEPASPHSSSDSVDWGNKQKELEDRMAREVETYKAQALELKKKLMEKERSLEEEVKRRPAAQEAQLLRQLEEARGEIQRLRMHKLRENQGTISSSPSIDYLDDVEKMRQSLKDTQEALDSEKKTNTMWAKKLKDKLRERDEEEGKLREKLHKLEQEKTQWASSQQQSAAAAAAVREEKAEPALFQLEYVSARRSFRGGMREDELTFRKGERLQVLSPAEDGFTCKLVRVGWVPATHVTAPTKLISHVPSSTNETKLFKGISFCSFEDWMS